MGFSGGSVVKNLSANAGDSDLISGSGRSPGGGDGNPPQYSCLENSMDRGAWWATIWGVAKSQTRLSEEDNTTRISTTAIARIELLSRVITGYLQRVIPGLENSSFLKAPSMEPLGWFSKCRHPPSPSELGSTLGKLAAEVLPVFRADGNNSTGLFPDICFTRLCPFRL